MLRSFLRLLSTPDEPLGRSQSSPSADSKLFRPPSSTMRSPTKPSEVLPECDHRARVLSMRLEHIKICGVKRCEQLRRANIITAGDLANSDPVQIVRRLGISRKAVATIRGYRRAIRLSASVSNLSPRDAQLLIAIHRYSVRSLSLESASGLHRDLQRFALSTAGARMLRNRRLPSLRKVKTWVAACRPEHETANHIIAA